MDPVRSALGEFSRRLLREEEVELLVPEQYLAASASIPNLISEALPARLEFPSITSTDTGYASLLRHGSEMGRLGGVEPAIDVVWIPGELESLHTTMLELIEEFLAAGYPGCRDCLGPAAIEPWDEKASRQALI